MKLYYETQRDEILVKNTVKGWIDNKQLHEHEKYIKPNLWMVDSYQWDQPNQSSIADSLADEHVWKEMEKQHHPSNSDYWDDYDKKVKKLAVQYYHKMDRNFPTSAINFMIKNKLGKNIDDLVNGRYLRLDVGDVVYDIMADEKKLARFKKELEREQKASPDLATEINRTLSKPKNRAVGGLFTKTKEKKA